MKILLAILGVCVCHSGLAAPSAAEFHRAVYALHERQVARHTVKTSEKTGELGGVAAAGYHYLETSYFEAASGRLLSKVERNAERPEAIHATEVYLYDDTGNVIRDFISIALPWAPQQPVRTWINLHHYNGSLHSFRQFDLAGEVTYEFCEGELDGERVRISLDGSDIDATRTASPSYRACFAGLRNDWQQYTTPH